MSIPGNWTLHYDWSSDGSYSTTNMAFKADGTWTSPSSGHSGRWSHVEGILIFNFSTAATIYAGLVASGSVTGNQTTFSGLTGSFYLLKDRASLKDAGGPGMAGDDKK